MTPQAEAPLSNSYEGPPCCGLSAPHRFESLGAGEEHILIEVFENRFDVETIPRIGPSAGVFNCFIAVHSQSPHRVQAQADRSYRWVVIIALRVSCIYLCVR